MYVFIYISIATILLLMGYLKDKIGKTNDKLHLKRNTYIHTEIYLYLYICIYMCVYVYVYVCI